MSLRLLSRQAHLVVFGYNAVTSKIGWVRNPISPQYVGSPLSLSGGQLMAYYKDGTVSDITDVCAYDPEEGTILEYSGELTIVARYTDHAGNEFTADTQIMVADIERIIFTGLADEDQKEGEPLDLSGAVLLAEYSDGTTRPIDTSGVIFTPADGTIIGHVESLSIQAKWIDSFSEREYSAQYDLPVEMYPEIDVIAGQNLSAGQNVYLGPEYLDTGVVFNAHFGTTISQNGELIYAGESAPDNYYRYQVASYHFDESGYPVKTDTIFSFPEGPTFPSGWTTSETTNASFDTSRFFAMVRCFKAGSNLYSTSSSKVDLIAFIIVDKDNETAVSGACQVPNPGPRSGWNYSQKVAKPAGNSSYAAVLCRNTAGADKALVINCLTGETSCSDTSKIIDLGDTTDQDYQYYCTGPNEVYIAAYKNETTHVVIKKASLSGGEVEDVFEFDTGDKYQGDLIFLNDSRIGICNVSKHSFDIFNLSGQIIDRIQCASSFSYPIRPYFNSLTQTVHYVCNSGYGLLFNLRARTGRTMISVRQYQGAVTSDNYVLAYASKNASGWEWYLYKKSYRAFATGSTTPSSDVPLGYALYGASTGDSVRVVVTYDPSEEDDE